MSGTKSISSLKKVMQIHQQITEQSSQQELFSQVIDSEKNTSLHIAFMQKLDEKVDDLLTQLSNTSCLINMKNKQGLSYLHIASARGNTKLVKQFIEAGVEVTEFINKTCPLFANYTPLQFACDSKSLETIRTLVEASKLTDSYTASHDVASAHATFQSKNQQNIMHLHHSSSNHCNALSLLHLACAEDNPGVIDCLLDRKADVNEQVDREATYCPLYTPLHFAVEFSCLGNVKRLLESGANVGVPNVFCMTALHQAMYYSTPGSSNRILELLYDAVKDKRANTMDSNGLTYFHIAAAMNDMKTVKKLLAAEVDINCAVLPNLRNFSNYTALHFAVKYSHQKMVKLLVSRGADLNTRETPTPLQVACEIGHTSLVQYLVKHSADATIVDPLTRRTTLHLLVKNSMRSNDISSTDLSEFGELSECIGLLVKRGVDVNAEDNDGNTVLHFACNETHWNELCVEELLDCGADVNVKNHQDKTPLTLAWENSLSGECNYEGLVMLYHHVQKLMDLGLEVDEKNEEFCRKLIKKRTEWSKNHDWDLYEDIYDDAILEAKHRKRLEEIEKLKRVRLGDEKSLYDFLRMDEERASQYAADETLKNFVEDPDGFWVKYPSYAYLIRLKRERCLTRIS